MDLFEKTERNAEVWRSRFCVKLDSAITKIDGLPCPARVEETRAIKKDIGWLQKIVWTVCIVGIPSLLGLAVVWGAVTNTVTRNCGRIDVLEKTDDVQDKDIVVLKERMHIEGQEFKAAQDGRNTFATKSGGLRV